MSNKELDVLINLILSEEVNSEEILSLNPHIKKSTIELKEKIELLKREMNTTKDLPWLEKAKLKKEAMKKAKEAIIREKDKFLEIARGLATGSGHESMESALQFFRERKIEDLSEEEIAELLMDSELLKEDDDKI